ncbi:HNH endonuclease [Fluviicola chungangensis]|uniref:HNH endonuclease n=1 Tax=Fluviicola chungangensis TaxID=2597671 RepID=A0A556MYA8_9FLAO|nr:hypothetical protein [Fluviicola chungangensis]TSJ44885.1 hypothetical protein FO442_09820 [Fluviicola chungangensis]
MHTIKITKELKQKAQEFSTDLFKNRSAHFVTPLERLEKLKSSIPPRKYKAHKKYVEQIIEDYDDLLKADPSELVGFVKKFDALPGSKLLNTKVPNKNFFFHESIVHAMRYDDLRSDEILQFMDISAIKCCVYCHAQLTIVTQMKYYNKKKKKGEIHVSGKLELDHYYPKSKYPFLSTSFFNLYPVCGNCNRSKLDKSLKFQLYSYSDDQPYQFALDDQTILDFHLHNDTSNIKYWFTHTDGKFNERNEFDQMFDIQGIYNTQKDLVEELLHKSKLYTQSYKDGLIRSFTSIIPDDDFLERILIGNYTRVEDVHKRPLAKFTQDIARQLKLI